jgi:hypothetical protein
MTPKELRLYAEAIGEKKKFENEQKLSYLWWAEWLHRNEEPPTLDEFLGRDKEEQKEMSPEEMLANVMNLNAAMGGSFENGGE